MQKMLTSVEGCPVMLMGPAGTPVWVIVWAPLSPGPKAPASRCSQSGQVPFPSVQAATVTPPTLQALNVGWSQVPVFAPVQHFQGVLRPVQLQVPVPVPLVVPEPVAPAPPVTGPISRKLDRITREWQTLRP